jgi:hypothetical protein
MDEAGSAADRRRKTPAPRVSRGDWGQREGHNRPSYGPWRQTANRPPPRVVPMEPERLIGAIEQGAVSGIICYAGVGVAAGGADPMRRGFEGYAK